MNKPEDELKEPAKPKKSDTPVTPEADHDPEAQKPGESNRDWSARQDLNRNW